MKAIEKFIEKSIEYNLMKVTFFYTLYITLPMLLFLDSGVLVWRFMMVFSFVFWFLPLQIIILLHKNKKMK